MSTTNTSSVSSSRSLTRPVVPLDPLEMQWSLLFTSMWKAEVDLGVASNDGAELALPWMDTSWSLFMGADDGPLSLSLMEDRLAHFAALYYAALDRHFRAEGSLAAKWWKPLTGEVIGTRQELSAQLGVNGIQLIVGCVCVLVLLLTSLFSMGLHRRKGGITWTGGVIDIISLLRDSSISTLIMDKEEDTPSELERLRRAEKIEIS